MPSHYGMKKMVSKPKAKSKAKSKGKSKNFNCKTKG